MAMELETKIMNDIGLGQHFNYFNGSGSCEHIRNKAAKNLEEAILNNTAVGEIAPPNYNVINVVKKVARIGDESKYSLTNTWQAASEAIAAHIHAANLEPEQQKQLFEETIQYIEQNYLPSHAQGSNATSKPRDYKNVEVIGTATARLQSGDFDHGLGKSNSGAGRSI